MLHSIHDTQFEAEAASRTTLHPLRNDCCNMNLAHKNTQKQLNCLKQTIHNQQVATQISTSTVKLTFHLNTLLSRVHIVHSVTLPIIHTSVIKLQTKLFGDLGFNSTLSTGQARLIFFRGSLRHRRVCPIPHRDCRILPLLTPDAT